MHQKTLDILDSELRRNHERYTNASSRDRQLTFCRKFQVDPVEWISLKTYFSVNQFVWNEFRYKDAVDGNDINSRIPSLSPGLYIFFVKAEVAVCEFPRFALYAGISNDRGSNRPLRDRLKDYFRISGIPKRNNVDVMLQLYYPHIWVAYTLLNWGTPKLKELETNLHEYLGFPFATQAYRPESKAARSAWDR